VPEVIPTLMNLSEVDFDYSVGPNIFKKFTYTFNVNLHGNMAEVVG